MDNIRVLLVGECNYENSSSGFNITLAAPLYLVGSWTCQVESIFLSCDKSNTDVRDLPICVVITCDFVEAVICNDTSIRLLTLCSLDSNTRGSNNIGVQFPLQRRVKVVKDYISHIAIEVRDQRLRQFPVDLLVGDIAIELLFHNNV